MEITKANINHLIEALFLIRQCTNELHLQQIIQWDEESVTMQLMKEDIENDRLYVVRNNNLTIGTMTLVPLATEAGYIKRTICIMHVAIIPFWQKKGIGRLMMNFAEKYAFDNGFENVKVNISLKNIRAIEFYTKLGYKKTKEFVSEKSNVGFVTFEKELVGQLV